MKIGIDISQIVYGTGVSTYTENLVRALLLEDRKNEYLLFAGSLRRKGELDSFFSSLEGKFESKTLFIPPTLADILWNRLHVLPIERLVGKLDVFHSSDWAQPPSKAFKVTTIHDLVPIRFPQYSHKRIVSAHKARLKWIKEEVNRVIVPSQASKVDLASYGVSKEKIRVISEAPGPIFKPAATSEVAKLKRKYKIPQGFLLVVGLGPRKNTQRIIEAFERARAGLNLKLVIVGRTQERYKLQRGVIFVGHVPAKDLPVFYSGAKALIYPSIYEGFGLPILEAFACKTPVVTSNISSLPEIAGGAAILVDPYEIDSIADGIKIALRRRKGLIAKGLRQVKQFSWQKAAKETLRVYDEKKKYG